MSRWRFASAPAALLLLLATGCGRVREIRACRGIAAEVNAATDEIEGLSKKVPVDESRIAKRYAALAKALEPRGVGDNALALALRDYMAILHATDVALRQHSDAQHVPNAKVSDSRRELERLVKRERAATIRIETECH